ncbi:MAG: ribose-phosphate pyrophosphokinase [Sphaerospermopsis sp. SIO1G2]|nr:ribose-phosphate pyrophosphokinase [Sphaerospermopsis sp. SIO1G2]
MLSKITIDDIPVNTILFPGGEVGVRLSPEAISHLRACSDSHLPIITAQLSCSNGVMALLNVANAVREYVPEFCLDIPYVPYARQDRICNPGESHAAAVFAQLVGLMKPALVWIADPHSAVAEATLRAVCQRVHVQSQKSLFVRSAALLDKVHNGAVLVAPDMGAVKKTEDLAKTIGVNGFVQGLKHRDLATGQLSGFGFNGDVEGKTAIIVDDICDGGGTFLGLASKLREGGAKEVILYVTHGIFSKGLHVFNDAIDEIYTTDSLPQEGKDQPLNDYPAYKGKFVVINRKGA